MPTKEWNIKAIVPEEDIHFYKIVETVGITGMTLRKWRESGRLKVYGDPSLTKGSWLLDAIRGEKVEDET